jgi:hypothetical protein
MVKVINGKRYNCDTAIEVAHRWNGLSSSDFNNLSETLYITQKGNFFLYGSGGPMTKYAIHVGDNISDGSDIISLTKEEAFEWCEEHSMTEAIEKYFPDMIEDA